MIDQGILEMVEFQPEIIIDKNRVAHFGNYAWESVIFQLELAYQIVIFKNGNSPILRLNANQILIEI